MSKCAVLGSPIAHSLSPVLHQAAYRELGLTGWTYQAIEVTEEQLPGFLEELDESWRGLSLTMPLKQSVIGLLDSISPVAEQAGAVNTVLVSDGLRVGANTDVAGAVAAVREQTATSFGQAAILGAGATASSMALALKEMGCFRLVLMVRNLDRGREVARRLADRTGMMVQVAPLDGAGQVGADIVVSTIPAQAQTPELVARFAEVPVVFDVIYHPWPTPLATSVGPGRTLVTGLELLIQQAAIQVGLMVDLKHVPTDAMREAGLAALAARSGS